MTPAGPASCSERPPWPGSSCPAAPRHVRRACGWPAAAGTTPRSAQEYDHLLATSRSASCARRIRAPRLRHLGDRGAGAAGDPARGHRARRVRADRRARRADHRGAVHLPAAPRPGAEDAAVLRALGAGPAMIMADGLPGILAAVAAGSLLAAAVAVALSPLSLFGPVRAVEPRAGNLPGLDRARAGRARAGRGPRRGGGRDRPPAGAAPRRGPQPDRRARGRPPCGRRLAAGLPVPGVAGLRFALEPGRGRTAVPVRSVIAASGAGRAGGHRDADLRRQPDHADLASSAVRLELQLRAVLDRRLRGPSRRSWPGRCSPATGWSPPPPGSTSPRPRSAARPSRSSARRPGPPWPRRSWPATGSTAPRPVVLGPATLAQLHQRIGDNVRVSERQLVPTLRCGSSARPRCRPSARSWACMPRWAPARCSPPRWSTRRRSRRAFGRLLAGPNAILIRLRPGVSQSAGPAVAAEDPPCATAGSCTRRRSWPPAAAPRLRTP